MKIPFDIKWKPQIESGEYKVETRDGRKARIIHWDLNCTSPIVAVMDVLKDTHGEIVDVFCVSGRAFDDLESPSDLFIVTPEPELTEWEKAIDAIYESCGVKELQVKKKAAELLELAKKELEEEVPEMEFIPIENTLEYKAGFRAGKTEAMKDLPRWNTHSGLFSNPRDDMNFKITSLDAPYLEIKKGNDFYFVRCSELLKLPGFKEDEK